MLKIAPSFMSANLLDVKGELRACDPYVDYYHVDIIDWHYVKNMCLTPQFIKAMKSATELPIEAHLYVDNIDLDLVDLCLDSGASLITMPADVIGRSVNRFAKRIHEKGCRMGIFLNPYQEVAEIAPYAGLIDSLLLMSVDPGFGGQEFISETYNRIKLAVEIRERLACHFQIAIDGNCSADRFESLARAGADAVSLGRGLFDRDPDTAEAARMTRKQIDEINAVLGSS